MHGHILDLLIARPDEDNLISGLVQSIAYSWIRSYAHWQHHRLTD